MNREHIKELDAKYIVHTYNRYDVVVDHAEGATITDANGKQYIDMCSGYGANSLGYANEAWLDAVKAQLDKVQHTSNLYYSEPGPLLAEQLVKRSGLATLQRHDEVLGVKHVYHRHHAITLHLSHVTLCLNNSPEQFLHLR